MRLGIKSFAVPDSLPSASGGFGPGGNPLFLNDRMSSATRSSAVMAVVNWAATSFVEPPLVVQKQTPDGWEADPEHAAVKMLAQPDPRSKSTMTHLFGAMVYDLVLDGNAYVHKLRGTSGKVVGLAYIPAVSVDPYCDPKTGVLQHYNVLVYGGVEKVPVEDVIHVMDGIDPNKPSKGRSRLRSIGREIMTDLEIATYQYAIMKAPNLKGIVSPKGDGLANATLDVAQIARDLKSVAGGENSGSLLIQSAPLDFTPLSLSPDQMALDQIPTWIEERITAVFGLPAVIAGLGAGLDRSTFSNYKVAREAAVEQFLVPKWRLVETALTMQLGADLGLGPSERFWFDITLVRALQEDQNDLWLRANAAFAGSTIDRATWKRLVGMKPLPEDEGVYAWQLKGTPLGDFMKDVVKGRAKDVPS